MNESSALPPDMLRYINNVVLLMTESRSEYIALFNRAADTICPTNALEWNSTRGYVDSAWEGLRQKNARATVINAAMPEALGLLLLSILRDAKKAANLTAEWFEGAHKRSGILAILQKYGLDENAITAKAISIRSKVLERIDRALNQAELSAMTHLREIQFHRRACSWRPPADLIEGSPAICLPPPPDKGNAAAPSKAAVEDRPSAAPALCRLRNEQRST